MRVSNYLLWQIAYAEIYVTETLWPDFRRRHLLEAVLAYQKRERRYGGITPAPAVDRRAMTRLLSGVALAAAALAAILFLPLIGSSRPRVPGRRCSPRTNTSQSLHQDGKPPQPRSAARPRRRDVLVDVGRSRPGRVCSAAAARPRLAGDRGAVPRAHRRRAARGSWRRGTSACRSGCSRRSRRLAAGWRRCC